MNCPNCKNVELLPTRLEENLACSTCQQCEGILLNLVTYRIWRESHPAEVEGCKVSRDTRAAAESKQALLCTKCERLMIKFRFAADLTHALDVCTHCEDVWLDRGEWDYVKARELHGNLTKTFTAPWQRRIRQQRSETQLMEIWSEKLGEKDHNKVREFATWLETHSKRSLIMGYLNSEDPYQP